MRSKGMVVVRSTATCNRCGDAQVAWVTSKRTGKPYLVAAYRNGDEIVANRLGFHKCGGGQPDARPEVAI